MKLNFILIRVFDITLATILLIVLGWLILLCAFYASIETKASGFYRQERVGRNGNLFFIFKIRTMRIVGQMSSNTTIQDDPRITNLGGYMRKLKIDELPQLFNVLKGDMSFVGPRPTVHSDFSRMNERQRLRVKVRPGITGLAQISGNTSLSWPERIELDLEYVQKQSLANNIVILLKTFLLIATNNAHTDPSGEDEWK